MSLVGTGLLAACSTPCGVRAPGMCLLEARARLLEGVEIQSVRRLSPARVENRVHRTSCWLYPGEYLITVVCKSKVPWGGRTRECTVPLSVHSGYRYELRADWSSQPPSVTLCERPHPTSGFLWPR